MPDSAQQLQRIYLAGFELQTFERYPKCIGVVRDNCVALLVPGVDGLQILGTPGWRMGEVMGVLTEREGRKVFQAKSDIVEATPERLALLLADSDRPIQVLVAGKAHPADEDGKDMIQLVVDFARSLGAKAIVKGLRAISDFEYELEMNQLNRRQDPEIESVYLMASAQYSFLSSSGVKELAVFGGRIDDLVPDGVVRRLQEELRR